MSVIATPPARRRPIRTFVAPWDAATVRTALLRERRRGGQSFVVVPRIEEIESIQAELSRLAPELATLVSHGELPSEEVDEVMVGFASGNGDVLLATNIIESGLDVPRANTMLVWRADLFGLAQLHRLRGRVGRGRTQGVAYLLHDRDQDLPEATRARLSTLEAFDRLGSGLAISARDLELRGAGDLIGDEQAGHVKLIGTALYQKLLTRAVLEAKGEGGEPDLKPEIAVGLTGAVPGKLRPRRDDAYQPLRALGADYRVRRGGALRRGIGRPLRTAAGRVRRAARPRAASGVGARGRRGAGGRRAQGNCAHADRRCAGDTS
ncbi:helicase-related protein [Phenylobacterium sp. LjRoot219]